MRTRCRRQAEGGAARRFPGQDNRCVASADSDTLAERPRATSDRHRIATRAAPDLATRRSKTEPERLVKIRTPDMADCAPCTAIRDRTELR